MEKGKITYKQDKRKPQFGSYGGPNNIGGLLLLGGAVAFASLVATFAIRKGNRRRPDAKDNNRRQRRRDEQASQGLHSVLQNSSPHANPCCASNESSKIIEEQIDYSTLILEENPRAVSGGDENYNNGDQMILQTNDSKQDSFNLCDKVIENDSPDEMPLTDVAMDDVKLSVEKDDDDKDYKEEKDEEAKEELLLEGTIQDRDEEEPIDAAEKTSMQSLGRDEDDGNFGEGSPLMETIEVRKDQEAIDDAPQITAELNLSIEVGKEQEAIDDAPQITAELNLSDYYSTEEEEEEEEADDDSGSNEDDDDDDDDDAVINEEFVMKKSEENSESDADEIWPAESVEELSEELKNAFMNSKHTMAEATEEDQSNTTEEWDHFKNSTIKALESCKDSSLTTQNLTFLKKEDHHELVVGHNGSTYLRKRGIWVMRNLVLAFIVLLLFTYSNHLLIFLHQDI